MLDHVICCVDGSDCSRRATSVGLSLAAAADASVDVVTVVPDSDMDERDLDALLGPVADDLAEAAVDVERHTLFGDASERIVSFATEREADLLAMGRRGRGGVGERLLGSTVHAVLRESEEPVLTVPEAADHFALSDLLVPTDGSDVAAWSAPIGATIAAQHDATFHSCYAVDPFTAAGPFSAGGIAPEVREQYEREGWDAIDGLLDLAREHETGLDTESDVFVAPPHDAIAEYVGEHGVDLVVMSSQGETSALGQVLGSVTDRVLRTVDVPVLVVMEEPAVEP